jgi:hypothetical protein
MPLGPGRVGRAAVVARPVARTATVGAVAVVATHDNRDDRRDDRQDNRHDRRR